MACFQRRALGKPSLLNAIRNLYGKIKDEKLPLEICLNIPISQILDPLSRESCDLFEGSQFVETIPLSIFTRFPKGKIIAGIFDHEDAKNNHETISNLRRLGLKIEIIPSYEELSFENFIETPDTIEKMTQQVRLPVGRQHFKALSELKERAERLEEHNPYLLLNEVSCTSVADFRIESVFDPGSRHSVAAWSYLKKTSFDILVVEKQGMTPVLAVEYDGPSHDLDDQIEKDRLKNDFCSDIRLPLAGW